MGKQFKCHLNFNDLILKIYVPGLHILLRIISVQPLWFWKTASIHCVTQSWALSFLKPPLRIPLPSWPTKCFVMRETLITKENIRTPHVKRQHTAQASLDGHSSQEFKSQNAGVFALSLQGTWCDKCRATRNKQAHKQGNNCLLSLGIRPTILLFAHSTQTG